MATKSRQAWEALLHGAAGIVAAIAVFLIASFILGGALSSFVMKPPRPWAEQAAQFDLGVLALYLAIDFGCAMMAGMAAGAIGGTARAIWGVVAGAACFLSAFWLASALPVVFFVPPPVWLDFGVVVAGSTVGALLAGE